MSQTSLLEVTSFACGSPGSPGSGNDASPGRAEARSVSRMAPFKLALRQCVASTGTLISLHIGFDSGETEDDRPVGMLSGAMDGSPSSAQPLFIRSETIGILLSHQLLLITVCCTQSIGFPGRLLTKHM